MSAAEQRVTRTGGRDATTRRIPPELALAVTMPSVPAPRGWKWSALTELARLESGHTPSRKHPEYWGGDIPWISIADAKINHGRVIHDTTEKTNSTGIENSSARVLPTGTVCLSRTASVGYVIVMGRPMATSQDFVNWICSKDLQPEFLKYLFVAEGDGLLRFASGAVHQTIYFPEAKAFHICHPLAHEQRRIVAILDEAFASIAIARANAERNLQNARELFEGQIDSVFLGCPEAWPKKPIRQCFKVKSGDFLPARSMAATGAYDVYGGNGIAGKHDQKNLSGENIVIGRVGAKCGNVRCVTGDIWLTDNAFFVSDYLQSFDLEFLARLLDWKRLRRTANQAAQPVISYSTIGDVMLQFPASKAEQAAWAKRLREFEQETQRLQSIYQRKLAAFDELKQSLLNEAFSGKL